MTDSHLTIGDVARLYSVPAWRVRRVVDSLDTEIPRAGNYRLVPRTCLLAVALKLAERGWLPESSKKNGPADNAGPEDPPAAKREDDHVPS